MKRLLLVLVIALSTHVASATPAHTVPPNLAPLAFSLGAWECAGQYEDVPPFTVRHAVKALFIVTLKSGWFDGQYVETSVEPGFAPLGISEHYAIDFFGVGHRRLEDGNYGKLEASLELTATGVHFRGPYTISTPFGPVTVTFDEDLAHPVPPAGTADQFSTESRLILPVGPNGDPVPVPFHRQTCRKRAGGAP